MRVFHLDKRLDILKIDSCRTVRDRSPFGLCGLRRVGSQPSHQVEWSISIRHEVLVSRHARTGT